MAQKKKLLVSKSHFATKPRSLQSHLSRLEEIRVAHETSVAVAGDSRRAMNEATTLHEEDVARLPSYM